MQSPAEKDLFRHAFRFIDDHQQFHLQTWLQWRQWHQREHRPNASALLDYLQQQPANVPILDLEHEVIYGETIPTSTQPTLFCCLSLAQDGADHSAETLPFFACQAALDCYRQQYGPAPVSIKWILQKQLQYEETKLKHIVTEQHAFLQPAPCLWYFTQPEGWEQYYSAATPPMFLGIKGLLSVDLTAHTTTATLPLHYGAIVPDAAWLLTWALGSIKNQHEDILIDGFYDAITPPEDQILATLATLPNDGETQRARWQIADFLPGLGAQYKHYAYFLTPTCNITHFHSGQSATSRPGGQMLVHDAQVRLDFLLVAEQNPQLLFNALQQHLIDKGFPTVHATSIEAQPPFSLPYQHGFTQQVRSALAHSYGHDPLILPYLPAPMPGGLLEHLNAPTILLPQPADSADADERFIATMKTFMALLILMDQHT